MAVRGQQRLQKRVLAKLRTEEPKKEGKKKLKAKKQSARIRRVRFKFDGSGKFTRATAKREDDEDPQDLDSFVGGKLGVDTDDEVDAGANAVAVASTDNDAASDANANALNWDSLFSTSHPSIIEILF